MRAAPAQALASPLIARKSQPIVIAIALIAPVNGALLHASQDTCIPRYMRPKSFGIKPRGSR